MAFAPDAPKQPEFVLSEQLEIFTSCKNLPKLNSYVIISQMDEEKDQFVEISKTESVTDNSNPEFTKQIIIDYRFEELQLIRVDIYRSDFDEYIGNCEFILADLVSADASKLTKKVKDKAGKDVTANDSPCFCIVQSEEVIQNTDELLIQFSCNGLPKMGWLTNTNPYLQVYRKAATSDTTDNKTDNIDDGWMCVIRTSALHKTYDPEWATIKIPIQRLCNGDYNREILIKCFHDDDVSQEEIGYCKTSLQQLLDTASKPLMHTTKIGTNCGNLLFHCQVNETHGFLKYIRGGMQIQMMIAVDFTASNKDPKTEISLHYIGDDDSFECESPYMLAIKSVGKVLEPYDSDGMIECYGFGANINPSGKKKVSHCFPLTLNDEEKEVKGIDGVLETYKQSLKKIQLYGPTYFKEIISTAAQSASKMVNDNKEQNYIILLIIADGVVNDMQKTIDTIVDATELPLSIVIVGVGDADFSAMVRLDADDEPLRSSNGVVMKRDIVQFVPFNKFKDKLRDLSKEVLEEIPGQIMEYMKTNNLRPLQKNNRSRYLTHGNEKKRKHGDECKDDNDEYVEPSNKRRKISNH